MKQYSLLKESISKDKEDYILNNTVYHSSNIKMDLIKSKFTENKGRFNYNVVYVSPYKWISSGYIVNNQILIDAVLKKYPYIKKENISKYDCISKEIRKSLNRLSIDTLQKDYPKHTSADIYLEDNSGKWIKFKNFKEIFTGYIHYIDYQKYKNVSFQDHPHPFEFSIKGNVKPFKVEKISIEFLIKCWDNK